MHLSTTLSIFFLLSYSILLVQIHYPKTGLEYDEIVGIFLMAKICHNKLPYAGAII